MIKINNIFSWPFFLKLLFWIVLLGLVAVFIEYSRLGLPDVKGPGHKDEQSLFLILFGVISLFTTLGAVWARLSTTLLLTLLCVLCLSNWWFFDFYRDFLTGDSLKLAVFAKETALSWDGLKFKQEAAIYIGSVISLLLIFVLLHRFRPATGALIVTGLIAISLGAQQQYAYLSRDIGGFKHKAINPVNYFVRSFFPKNEMQITASTLDSVSRALPTKSFTGNSIEYPLYQPVVPSTQPTRYSNVILVVLESVRAAETGLYPESMDSITPELDQFAARSLNLTSFYANSNQTVRGEVALLCSAMDYINGAPYSMSGNPLPTNCLPSILAQYGYDTHWFHGYDKNFFNRDEFFPTLGFQNIHDQAVINANSDKSLIGWGVNDPAVFDYALDQLQELEKPFFAEILTLSNHYPYLWDWEIEFPKNLQLHTDLNEDEDNLYQAYRRGVYYTDKALGQFLKRFESSNLADNTLLIITGDHGIWTFPDELLNQDDLAGEIRRNEIYFRLPLLIHAPDLPAEVRSLPASQVDIPPTVLDYLGIEFPNAFIGSSLLQADKDTSDPVYFIAAGSFGVRDQKQYCYPVDTSESCSEVYRNCDSYESEAKSVCIETPHDLMLPDIKYELMTSDQTDENTLIDLTQYLLRHEFIPSSELLQSQ